MHELQTRWSSQSLRQTPAKGQQQQQQWTLQASLSAVLVQASGDWYRSQAEERRRLELLGGLPAALHSRMSCKGTATAVVGTMDSRGGACP